jgi:hypothetical protein
MKNLVAIHCNVKNVKIVAILRFFWLSCKKILDFKSLSISQSKHVILVLTLWFN